MNKGKKIGLMAAALLFSVAATARAQDNSSIVEQFAVTSPAVLQSLLQKGQLIFIDNEKPGKPQFVTVITLFNAPIEKVFSTIVDYDHYVGNIPQTTEVKITKKQGNTWFVKYRIEFKFSIIAEHANYVLKQILDPPGSVTWTRVSGNLDRVEGSWKLISIDNGKETIGFYRVYTDISSLGFLVRYMLEKQPLLNTAIATSSALVYAKAMEKWVDKNNKQGTAQK